MTSALDRPDGCDLAPLRCGDRLLPVGERTLLMGILNTSPESFSGDGVAGDVDAALAQAEAMVAEGADIVDVGGQSTRPGSEPVGAGAETARAVPVVAAIAERLDCVVSIDTSEPEVARRAVEAGAGFVNDVFGLRADRMIETVARADVPACIMHMRGTPRTMQADPRYDDLMGEILEFLAERVDAAVAGGIARTQLVVDPGFGFGKTVAHNLEMLRRLGELRGLGLAVLLGTSRKSTIGTVLDLPVDERVFGGAATCALGIAGGADILRVHDVREMKQVAVMTDAIVSRPKSGRP